MTTTSNKRQRALQVHDDMVKIVQAWDASSDKVLTMPVASKGEGVHIRQLFYMWRDEMTKLFSENRWVQLAREITVRSPYEPAPGQWLLDFVQANQGLKTALASLGIPATPPSTPTFDSHTTEPTEPPAPADDAFNEVWRKFYGDSDAKKP